MAFQINRLSEPTEVGVGAARAQRLEGEDEVLFWGARVAFPLKAVTWEMIFFLPSRRRELR